MRYLMCVIVFFLSLLTGKEAVRMRKKGYSEQMTT
jgi:hypothetical protein